MGMLSPRTEKVNFSQPEFKQLISCTQRTAVNPSETLTWKREGFFSSSDVNRLLGAVCVETADGFVPVLN